MDDKSNNQKEENIKTSLTVIPNKTSSKKKEQLESKYQTRKKFIDFAKIGEKLSLTGSNCHYCKSIMTVKESNACRFISDLNGKYGKKRSCNKKFCFDCLEKHFIKHWESRLNKDWKCPCCTEECNCINCKRVQIREKKDEYMNNIGNSSEGMMFLGRKGSNLVNSQEGRDSISSIFKQSPNESIVSKYS